MYAEHSTTWRSEHCYLYAHVRQRSFIYDVSAEYGGNCSSRSNNKKYLLTKESCQTRIDLRGDCLFAEFVGPDDDFFMGTISVKDLVFIPLLNTLNILLHIYDKKLCARPDAWTFWHEQVPSPHLNSTHNRLVQVMENVYFDPLIHV